jgi:hypothetical protein
MKERRVFIVKMEMEVTVEDVLDFLELEYDSDYEPTDGEWLECARDQWESENYDCIFSEVNEA